MLNVKDTSNHEKRSVSIPTTGSMKTPNESNSSDEGFPQRTPKNATYCPSIDMYDEDHKGNQNNDATGPSRP